jgi:Protein of unknown function (DUF4239)
VESLFFAIGVAVLTFGAGVLGLKLHEWLPEKHAPDRSREMIGAITGLLGLLLALVLGTLVGSAYSLYALEKSEIETLSARALQLDSALEALGPEAQPGRDGLRKAITQSYNRIWGHETADNSAMDVKSVIAGGKILDQFLASLTPKTDAEKQALANANAAATQIQQTRILMDLQLASGVNWAMLAIVVCWSLLLFCGYGLVSPVNATVVVSLALGAIAVASALFLIIELTNPFVGLIRLSPGPVVETLRALGS